MTSLEFKKLLGNSLQGTKIVYYTGSLMYDRQFSKDADKSAEVDRLANTVWKAAGMKWVENAVPTAKDGHQGQWLATGERRVILTQRKLSDPFGFEYTATKV